MTLRKWESTENSKRKHEIAFSGEFSLEEAMYLLQDRLHYVNNRMKLLVFITEAESVYYMVRTDPFNYNSG